MALAILALWLAGFAGGCHIAQAALGSFSGAGLHRRLLARSSSSGGLAVARKASASTLALASARWPLARALWALGQRDAALSAARQAARELSGGVQGARLGATIRAWLAARAR